MDLLEVRNVTKEFEIDAGLLEKLFGTPDTVKAVSDVSFTIDHGETFGLVGESGAGKSTIANLITRFHKPTSGKIVFDGVDTSTYLAEGEKEMRQAMQMVFQQPSGSIDPRYQAGEWIEESLIVHTNMNADEREQRVLELLETVGLSEEHADHYSHELSGGQLQRVSIATALAVDPDLIVLDEPVSALDKSVQFRILKLLKNLQQEHDIAYLLISHDLRVIDNLCDRVGVLYLGEMVETGPTDEVFDQPRHPYTESLIEAMPPRDPNNKLIEKEPPSPLDPPSGCSFHPRCPYATELCASEKPGPESAGPERSTACHHWGSEMTEETTTGFTR